MTFVKGQIVALLVGFFISAATASAAQDEIDSDAPLLEGTWNVASIEAGGRKMEAAGGAPEKAVIKDGKVTFFSQGKEMSTFKNLKLQVDAKKKPKALDLVRNANETLPCIYELTQDEWKIAMPLVPKDKKPDELLPRPESFDTSNQPVMVLTAKRVKN